MNVYTYSEDRQPLDVEGLDLGLSADEIVQMVREGRRTDYRVAVDWREYVEVTPKGSATICSARARISESLA